MSERLSIDVSRDMLDRAKDAVETGSYESTSAVVDEALRLWAAQRDQQMQAVREELEGGFASPMRQWRGAEAETVAWRERFARQRPE